MIVLQGYELDKKTYFGATSGSILYWKCTEF